MWPWAADPGLPDTPRPIGAARCQAGRRRPETTPAAPPPALHQVGGCPIKRKRKKRERERERKKKRGKIRDRSHKEKEKQQHQEKNNIKKIKQLTKEGCSDGQPKEEQIVVVVVAVPEKEEEENAETNCTREENTDIQCTMGEATTITAKDKENGNKTRKRNGDKNPEARFTSEAGSDEKKRYQK